MAYLYLSFNFSRYRCRAVFVFVLSPVSTFPGIGVGRNPNSERRQKLIFCTDSDGDDNVEESDDDD